MTEKNFVEVYADGEGKPEGKLTFSEDVLTTIIGIAAMEVDGIVEMSGGILTGIAEKVGRKSFSKGIKVEAGAEEVSVDIRVVVEYGKYAPDIYKELVKKVSKAVRDMTGLKVKEIKMLVEGLHLPKDKEQDE